MRGLWPEADVHSFNNHESAWAQLRTPVFLWRHFPAAVGSAAFKPSQLLPLGSGFKPELTWLQHTQVHIKCSQGNCSMHSEGGSDHFVHSSPPCSKGWYCCNSPCLPTGVVIAHWLPITAPFNSQRRVITCWSWLQESAAHTWVSIRTWQATAAGERSQPSPAAPVRRNKTSAAAWNQTAPHRESPSSICMCTGGGGGVRVRVRVSRSVWDEVRLQHHSGLI